MWEELKKKIEGGKRFLLTTHILPDGDAIGSELALSRFLRGRGKSVSIVNPDEVPSNFAFMARDGEIEVLSHPFERGDWAAVFILDTGSPDRLGRMAEVVDALPVYKIVIDHHERNDVEADLKIVSTAACSTAELIYGLIRESGERVGKEIALPLYVALHTDTVSFNFLGTNATTHRIVGDLLEAGLDPASIYEKVYMRDSWEHIRKVGSALTRVESAFDGRVAVMKIPREFIASGEITPYETESYTRYPLTIEGVRIVVLFYEMARGRTRVGLRALGDVDVGLLATKHGGGGHSTAAGVVLESPLDEAERIILGEIGEALKKNECSLRLRSGQAMFNKKIKERRC